MNPLMERHPPVNDNKFNEISPENPIFYGLPENSGGLNGHDSKGSGYCGEDAYTGHLMIIKFYLLTPFPSIPSSLPIMLHQLFLPRLFVLHGQMRIPIRHGQVRMPYHLVDIHQSRAGQLQIGAVGVPQIMEMKIRQSHYLARFLKGFPELFDRGTIQSAGDILLLNRHEIFPMAHVFQVLFPFQQSRSK